MLKDKAKNLANQLGASVLDDMKSAAKPMSTGCVAFDYLLQGGIPSGLITEFVGDFSTGKSLLGLQICRESINSGGVAIFIDSENSMNKSWATEVLKVDPKQLIYFSAADLEQTYDFLDHVINKHKFNKPCVIVWDSVAATPPAVTKGTVSGSTMAAAARVHSLRLPTLLKGLRESDIGLLLINQLRSKIGVMYGQKWESYGGRAIRFYSSLRVHIVKTGRSKLDKATIGTKGRAEIIKSRISRPFTSIDFTIDFERGITPWSGTLELFRKAGLIKSVGGMQVFSSNSHKCRFKSSQIGDKGICESLWTFADKDKLTSALNIKE